MLVETLLIVIACLVVAVVGAWDVVKVKNRVERDR